MDILPVLRQAWDADRELLENVDDLSAPTRCTEWDTRALINHLIGDNHMFTAFAQGAEVDFSKPMPDLVGNDPKASFEQATKNADAAFTEPGALERTWVMPIGNMPGSRALAVLLTDMVVHGLDLAHATDQKSTALEALADGMYGQIKGSIPDQWRGPGKPFAAEVPVPDDAPGHKKLVGTSAGTRTRKKGNYPFSVGR